MSDPNPSDMRERGARPDALPDTHAESAPDSPGGWRAFGRRVAAEVGDSLGHGRLSLSAAEREHIARRIGQAVTRALDVPPDLPARIRRRVDRFRSGRKEDPVSLAWERTRLRARRTAAIGTVTTVPAMIPVLGPALAALGLVADWRLVAEQQRDLVLEIAALFDVMPEDPTREVRGLFLASAGSAFVGSQVGEAVVRVAAREVAERSVSRLLPGVGAAVAGALNYAATVAIGRAAIEQFAERAGVDVRGLLPKRVHAAMAGLRKRVAAPPAAVRGPRLTDEERAVVPELSDPEREELLDVAAAGALERGLGLREEQALRELAGELDLDAAAADAVLDALERDMVSARRRVGRLLRRSSSATGEAARTAWRGASRIARSGLRRARRKGADGPERRDAGE